MGTSFLCVFWYLTLYRKLVPFSIPKGIIVYTKYYTLSSAGQQYNKKEQHYVEIPKTCQIILLILGISMISYGAVRGEAATVLGKAIKLCLECVGIG